MFASDGCGDMKGLKVGPRRGLNLRFCEPCGFVSCFKNISARIVDFEYWGLGLVFVLPGVVFD